MARELGIPAVVGVPGVTKILTSGDLIKLDGALELYKFCSSEPSDV